jgi:hypothetical protein
MSGKSADFPLKFWEFFDAHNLAESFCEVKALFQEIAIIFVPQNSASAVFGGGRFASNLGISASRMVEWYGR